MVALTADNYNPAKIEEQYADGLSAKVRRRFMGKDEVYMLPTRYGLQQLLEENGLGILSEKIEVFMPPEEADSDEAIQYCFVAIKK